jgi:ABC-2 type transport system ATP-binding protein
MVRSKDEKYWSKFAQGYDDGVYYIVGEEIQLEISKRLLEEHNLGNIIEFGCGTGCFTKIIARAAKQVIATDISKEMLEVAKNQLKDCTNTTFEEANCENASFSSNTFDTVFMANVIHFIKEPKKALKESYRILKPGGLLLLVDYTGFGMKWSDKMKLGIRFIKTCGIPPRHFKTDLTPDEFSYLIRQAGFKIENIEVIDKNTRALYLKGRKFKKN